MFTNTTGLILYTLQDIAYQIYFEKISDFGYIYVSTTILMFIFEIKNTFKIKRLEKRLRVMEAQANVYKK